MAAKYLELSDILRKEIEDASAGGGGKLATETELCRRFGMSRHTVRRALAILEDEGLIERRQGSGSYIKQKKEPEGPRQIAVITSFLDDYIFPTILHDAQNVFAREGYSTLVYATENKVGEEREILRKILGLRVSGILIEGSKTALPTPNADLYEQLRQSGVPILFLHGIYSNLSGFPSILDDNYSGGYRVARYLLSKGHRRIAGIFKSDDMQGPQRYHGVISALRDAGIRTPDKCICWYDTEDRHNLMLHRELHILDAMIASRFKDVTAVVCYNDEIAHLLIQRLTAAGKRVPEDIAVVSFDNSNYSRIGPVTITSLGHGASRTGRVAAGALIDLLKGGEPNNILLEWELVERVSG